MADFRNGIRAEWLWLAVAGALFYPVCVVIGIAVGWTAAGRRTEAVRAELERTAALLAAAERKVVAADAAAKVAAEKEPAVDPLQPRAAREIPIGLLSQPPAIEETPAKLAPAVPAMSAVKDTAVAESQTEIPEPETPASESYWLTTKTGIRHKSSCRYYGKSAGGACGPNDGRACEICGG